MRGRIMWWPRPGRSRPAEDKHYNAVYSRVLLMNPTSTLPTRDAFLMAVGETIRTARARRGMTRRMLATEAGVSERHLANLESGLGNASILVLRQVAQALGCPLAELVDAKEGSSPEGALLRDLLRDRSENE